jgi:hypothetical protein
MRLGNGGEQAAIECTPSIYNMRTAMTTTFKAVALLLSLMPSRIIPEKAIAHPK